MSYTTTITFPVETIKTGDTLQLIIEFTHDATGSNRAWDAYDYGMKVTKWDKLEMSYDIEDALMVPASFKLELSDSDGELDGLFFGSSAVDIAADKQAKVTIKHNGTNKLVGHIIEDSIYSNPSLEQVKFTAAPKMDVINKRMLYEDSTALNPFSLTQNNYYRFTSLLEDIFGLVDSSITYASGKLEVIHDWQFWGKRDSTECFTRDIEFTEIFQYVNPLYFDTSYGLNTCGDLLRKLALDWCAFTGMLSTEKAFFKKLFHYDSDNLQSVTVLKHEKGFRYGLLDYVKVTTGISPPNEPYEAGTFTELENRYISRKSLPGFFHNTGTSGSNIKAVLSRTDYFVFDHGSTIGTPPYDGSVYSNNGSNFEVTGMPFFSSPDDTTAKIVTKRISGTNNPDASGTLTKVSGVIGDATYTYTSYGNADGTYSIYQSADPNVVSMVYNDHGSLMAQFWIKYRGNIQNCRVDKFLFYGVDYDFLKDFNYDSSKYQPIGMKINWSECTTECEAIYIGSLYGDEKITNPGFDSDTTWSKQTGWSISGGTANCDGTQPGARMIFQSQTDMIVTGHTYKLSFEVTSYTAGNVQIKYGGSSFTAYENAIGIYTYEVTATEDYDYLGIQADINFVGSVDNVSVREVL